MRKKIVVLIIQILVIALVLGLTVTTFAWFTSQTQVSTTQNSVTAAAGSNTTIEVVDEIDPPSYMGQTGAVLTGNDVPYTRTLQIKAVFSPTSSDAYLAIALTSAEITMSDGNPYDECTAEERIAAFTWRAEIDSVIYGPDGHGLAINDEGEHYKVTPEVETEFTLTLIFLSEAAYVELMANGSTNKPFAFHDYKFMYAIFNCAFEIGFDALVE